MLKLFMLFLFIAEHFTWRVLFPKAYVEMEGRRCCGSGRNRLVTVLNDDSVKYTEHYRYK